MMVIVMNSTISIRALVVATATTCNMRLKSCHGISHEVAPVALSILLHCEHPSITAIFVPIAIVVDIVITITCCRQSWVVALVVVSSCNPASPCKALLSPTALWRRALLGPCWAKLGT